MLSVLFLSDTERAQLKIQHRQERDGRVRDRIKAVLLFDKGWSIPAIAEALLLSEDAIREHIVEYRESKKLKPENGGSVPKLSSEHSDQLVKHLQSHTYLYVKDIIAYVQSTWSVTYSVPGMRNWLQRMVFPIRNPHLCQAKPMDSNNESGWLSTRS
jgi:Predicted transcriptional regulator